MSNYYRGSNSYKQSRATTPHVRPDQAVITRMIWSPEGHYELIGTIAKEQVEVYFHRYHKGEWSPPILIMSHLGIDSAKIYARVWESVWCHKGVFRMGYDRSNTWSYSDEFEPQIVERERQINQMVPDWDHKIRKMRNYRRYVIEIDRSVQMCDDWATDHTHAVMVIIKEAGSSKVILQREFGCGEVLAGIDYYHDIKENFSDALMEGML